MKLGGRNKNKLTRRDLLGTASLAGLGTALLSAPELRAQEQQAYQTGKDPGKHEPIADFKFDLEATRGWVGEAGSAKEATIAEFPASQHIAGVSMRLKPGGIRELHWHAIAAEWALMLRGTVMTTVIAPNGEPATDIFEAGGISYFPEGHRDAPPNIWKKEAPIRFGFCEGPVFGFWPFRITGLSAQGCSAAGTPTIEMFA